MEKVVCSGPSHSVALKEWTLLGEKSFGKNPYLGMLSLACLSMSESRVGQILDLLTRSCNRIMSPFLQPQLGVTRESFYGKLKVWPAERCRSTAQTRPTETTSLTMTQTTQTLFRHLLDRMRWNGIHWQITLRQWTSSAQWCMRKQEGTGRPLWMHTLRLSRFDLQESGMRNLAWILAHQEPAHHNHVKLDCRSLRHWNNLKLLRPRRKLLSGIIFDGLYLWCPLEEIQGQGASRRYFLSNDITMQYSSSY